jgi:hypothetical protein
MDDDWQFPAPRDDPEARKAKPGQESSGCPRIVPDGNFVEGEMPDEDSALTPPPSP